LDPLRTRNDSRHALNDADTQSMRWYRRSMSRSPSTSPSPDVTHEVEVLMRASKVVSAAIAHSLAVADARVTLPQLRVLVMLQDRGPLNMAAVADGLGVNPSNASRTCDRLVRGGLVNRREDADDRRNVALTLTPEGERVVGSMLRQRQAIFAQVVERMGTPERASLASGLAAFSDVAGELSAEGVGLSDGDGHLLRWLA
jgi:DNA-binding MarR family transcriptional regulator